MKSSKPLISESVRQYLVDASGKKTAVVIDIKTFEKLLEEIEDIYFTALAEVALEKETEEISHKEAKRRLLEDD